MIGLRLKNAGELPIVNLLGIKSFYAKRWYRDLTQHQYLYNILIYFIKNGILFYALNNLDLNGWQLLAVK